MLIFTFGWSSDGGLDLRAAETAIERVVDAVPFFGRESVRTWSAPSGSAALAFAGHTPDQVGGASYTHLEERRAGLFTGRPFHWSGEVEADGRGPIDASFYVDPPSGWMDDLDGRAAAARYDDDTRTLEVFTNALGSYPLYTTSAGGGRWFSNSPGALALLRPGPESHDAGAIATFVGCGWPLGGKPIWRDVERLPRGTARRLSPAGDETIDLLPTERVIGMFGQGWSPTTAARAIVQGTGALADWPGRPPVIPLTGGRDSRLVFAAARHVGVPFQAETTAQPGLEGYPETEDVRLARMLCERTGSPHTAKQPSASVDLQTAIAAFRLVSPGAFSLGDVGLTPSVGAQEDYRLPILLQGLGGELARTFYGSGEGLGTKGLVTKLYRTTTKVWPRTLLSGDGKGVVRGYLTDWVERHTGLGAAPAEIPDLFYLLERMVNWAAPTQGLFEAIGDETVPVLWNTRLLPHQVGQSRAERDRERFHVPVLEELDPSLLEVPFELMNHPSTLQGKLRAEAIRRARLLARRRPGGSAGSGGAPAPVDPFPDTMAQTRELVLAQPQHEAWAVLDEKRVRHLLGSDPAGLHSRGRHQVYRLASVFFTGESPAP